MAAYDPKEDCLVSVHEAAHSIACYAQKFQPIEAHIWLVNAGGWFTGGVVGCGVTYFTGASESDRYGLAVVCYAGAAGEALLEHKVEGISMRRAMQNAMPGAGSDYAAAQALYQDHPMRGLVELPMARQEAAQFVEDNWPEIEFIGRAIRIERSVHFRHQRERIPQ